MINTDRISNSKFTKEKNVFFISAKSSYFKSINNTISFNCEKDNHNFILEALSEKKFFNFLQNVYFLDFIDNYVDFIKFSKSEQKFIKYKKKKAGKYYA